METDKFQNHLNDRIATMLGRAIIKAESLEVEVMRMSEQLDEIQKNFDNLSMEEKKKKK